MQTYQAIILLFGLVGGEIGYRLYKDRDWRHLIFNIVVLISFIAIVLGNYREHYLAASYFLVVLTAFFHSKAYINRNKISAYWFIYCAILTPLFIANGFHNQSLDALSDTDKHLTVYGTLLVGSYLGLFGWHYISRQPGFRDLRDKRFDCVFLYVALLLSILLAVI